MDIDYGLYYLYNNIMPHTKQINQSNRNNSKH